MEQFFTEQFLFLAVLFVILIIPGWFFLIALFPHNQFAPLEKFVLSVPLSFSLLTLTIIVIDACTVSLTYTNILITLITLTVIPLITHSIIRKNDTSHVHNEIFAFSKKQTFLIIILVIMTIAIKGLFLINTIFPTATDLGHHMFWVEKIVKEHSLPQYEKIEILTTENDSHTLSEPQKIADFIVGEHILFAIVKTFTGQSTVSTFPSLILLVINIFTVLILFILSRRFFERYYYGVYVAILTLLFIGPLWTISGAGAKFVSGGVIGNVIGNLLIPTIFYFLYRAFVHKDARILIPALLTTTALIYTHHLSTLIFGYAFIFSIIAYVIVQKNGLHGYTRIFSLLRNYYIVPLLIIMIAVIFVIHPPSYLDSTTIATSIGAPEKSSRTGISFTALMYTLGEARFIFGVIGFFILSLLLTSVRIGRSTYTNKSTNPTNIYAGAFLIGWCGALLGMTLFPHILQVNIISSRIATYCIFPLAILAGFSIVCLATFMFQHKNHTLKIPQVFFMLTYLTIFSYIFITGMHDNATSLNAAPKTNAALQTFHAGKYASEAFENKIMHGDFWMVKDHNYIVADTWIKVFFANDYSYPLSRSFFKRYETNPQRETCTLEMISTPDSPTARTCFNDLTVQAVLVDTDQDASQFTTNDQFERIYQNNDHSLFIKK